MDNNNYLPLQGSMARGLYAIFQIKETNAEFSGTNFFFFCYFGTLWLFFFATFLNSLPKGLVS